MIKSLRPLKVLWLGVFLVFGWVMTSPWIRAEAEPPRRSEPAGTWGADRQGRTTLNDVLFTGVQTQWHPNGQKYWEIPYRDGKINGTWVRWYQNGQKESETTYRDGKINGISVGWDENGQKALEITYRDGKFDGTYVTWYENGQKTSEWIYREGKIIDGTYVVWHPNGQKAWEGTYRDGKQDGTLVGWHLNGQKKSETTYRDGKIIDETSARYPNTQITLKGAPTALTLGAQLQVSSSTGSGQAPHGLTVISVTPQSPADRASLQVGDRLLTLEGQPVPKTVSAFLTQLAAYAEGSIIKLIVERAGASHTLLLPWTRQGVPNKKEENEGKDQEPQTGPSGHPH